MNKPRNKPDPRWDHLPPLLRSQAMHTPLPRNRRLPLIGIAFTIALHLLVVGVIYLRSDKAPEKVFFLKLLPLDESQFPQNAAPAAPSPASAPPAPAAAR